MCSNGEGMDNVKEQQTEDKCGVVSDANGEPMDHLQKQCADYFKKQGCLERCFREMRRKWESYGRAAGTVCLSEVTEGERRALGGILGKNLSGDTIRFTLREFEAALGKTRYASITLKQLLEAYFGAPLLTNQERKDFRKNEEELFFQQLESCFQKRRGAEAEQVIRWLREMERQKKWGYSILLTEWKRQAGSAASLVRNVGRAAEIILEETGESPLAVLSARVTNNPHYFDRGTAAGNLLLHFLCFWKECVFPKNAYDWRQLLLECGIAPDPVSNTVAVYGIHFALERGFHPAYEAFCRLGEPCVVTLENLKRIRGAHVECSTAFAVENEMVFSYLVDHCRELDTALLCTSGQVRTASLEVIRMLAESGTRICYSGDLDPEGMTIADKLWQRYPEQIRIWRMSRKDYGKSISAELIDEKRLIMLQGLKNPLLRQTAEELLKKKKAGYQENLLGELVEDIQEKRSES